MKMTYLRYRLCFCTLMLLVVIHSHAQQTEKIIEIYPTGSVFREYMVNKDGQRAGFYQEYYPDGKDKVKAHYLNDLLTGKYIKYAKDGSTLESRQYRAGELHGSRVKYENGKMSLDEYYIDGQLIFPKSKSQINQTLNLIQSKTISSPGDANVQRALKRLMQYRYLSDLAWEDMELDDRYNQLAQAGAEICKMIGRLDHTPDNPGMAEEDYKLAYSGTSRSNLSMGPPVYGSVDSYMNDSDRSNIDRVGHRRWCLNPKMKKTGFGYSGKWSAMYSFDQSRSEVPDYDYVAFPARGYMPATHFKADYAWSISLNPRKYRKPSKNGVKVSVRPIRVASLSLKAMRVPSPIPLSYFNVELSGFGISNCIIFRPSNMDSSPGKRYWVTIEGIQDIKGKPAVIEYLVEFI